MKRAAAHGLLVLGVFVAACGGAASLPPPATAPAGSSSASPSVASGPAETAPAESAPASSAAAPSASSAVAAPPGPPPAPVDGRVAAAGAADMKAPIPSALAGELRAIGLDASALPPIAKLEPTALRRVMKLFAKSLGVKCGDCHAGSDFAAPTRRKKIAAKMWDELAAKLQMSDGSPLFCDSCHQGRIVQLDRRDKKALEAWMNANFVDKLKRKDGLDHGCETCHVGKEMKLLTKWGGG